MFLVSVVVRKRFLEKELVAKNRQPSGAEREAVLAALPWIGAFWSSGSCALRVRARVDAKNMLPPRWLARQSVEASSAGIVLAVLQ